MRKPYTFLILGIWVAVLPYLGFPYAWKEVLFTVSGVIIVIVSYLFYKEVKANGPVDAMEENGGTAFDNFRENKFPNEDEKDRGDEESKNET